MNRKKERQGGISHVLSLDIQPIQRREGRCPDSGPAQILTNHNAADSSSFVPPAHPDDYRFGPSFGGAPVTTASAQTPATTPDQSYHRGSRHP